MSIIRVEKNKANPYVMIDKRPLQDPSLTCKAKGLLAYLLSLPDDWEVHVDEVVTHFKDGRDSIRSAFKELRDAGYAKLERNPKGGSKWTVSENRKDAISVSRNLPLSENPTLLNKDSVLKKEKNTKKASKVEEELELPFQSESFKETWAMWEEHRRKKNPLTNLARSLQFTKAKKLGEEHAIEAIKAAIMANYRDFFELRGFSPVSGRIAPDPKNQEAEEKPETPQWKFRLDRMLKEVTDENASPLHMAWFNAMPVVGRQEWLKKATTGQLEALNNALRNAYNALYHV